MADSSIKINFDGDFLGDKHSGSTGLVGKGGIFYVSCHKENDNTLYIT
jgi:hypothetical protein